MANSGFAKLNPNAAGVDIGSTSHFVAVPEDRCVDNVREFSAFTGGLEELAEWLAKCCITSVAMESTGVYWIPLYELLETRGFEVKLVNARHVKNVSGRKSDVSDCQWLQQLHSYGLLSGAFRPDEEMCGVRAIMRQRATLIQYASSHTLHMQKALDQMNVHIHHVIADITGATGLKIIQSILDGERDPSKLAALRHSNCKSDTSKFEQALKGQFRSEHIFSLRQAFEIYKAYQQKIKECDQEIESRLALLENKVDVEVQPLPPSTKRIYKKKPGNNEISFDVRPYLYQKAGVDLTRIDGINTSTALTVLTEIGFSVVAWKTERHFASWLGLCPNNKITGGKVFKSKTNPSSSRAATALRMAASTLSRSETALGAYYRKMKTRLGAPKAITATAHKLARLVYSMLRNGTEYTDQGVQYYEEKYRARVVNSLKRRAKELGLELVETAGADSMVPA